MEIKKTDRANLERRRGEMFLIAVVLIVSFLFAAFEWDMSLTDAEYSEMIEDAIQEIDFEKLKKDNDMVAAIEDNDEADVEQNNVKPAELVTQQQVENTSSKLLIGEGESEIAEAKVEEAKPQVLDNNINEPEGFHAIEVLPQFPGGASAFMKWITANLKYPQEAQNSKLQGRVVVSFLVTADGEVHKLKIEKSDNALLSREVIRVLDKMPKWEPGKQNGVPCTSMVAVPINFQL